jgi:prophage antirepressor-like protein
MPDLSQFSFGGLTLRTVLRDGQPWFVAADVCRCLGLSSLRGTHKYLRHLGEEEKQLLTHAQIGGSKRGSTAISESGLYKLIMRSDKKEAKVFQDWVTGEVLPTIRQTGGYLLNETKRSTAGAADRLTAPGDVGVLWNKVDALTRQVEELSKLMADAVRPPSVEARLNELPEWLTARAVADIMGSLNPRIPASGQFSIVQSIGVELTGFCRLNDWPIARVKSGGQTANRYPRDAVREWLTDQRRVAAA